MDILLIDDQHLVRLSLEKHLGDLGFQTKAVDNGYRALDVLRKEQPRLIILDINMPEMTGLELLRHIKAGAASQIPVMILSGNHQDGIISEAFALGVTDYMKKPLSLSELGARVGRLLGTNQPAPVRSSQASSVIQEHYTGVVIPCYNEGDRLEVEAFRSFVDRNLGYRLCFVNDGSTDNTLEVLHELQRGREDRITVYDCARNGGKAEAVRQGMLHMAKDPEIDHIGFLDADLSTDFEDFDSLVRTLRNSQYQVVSGSRIARMGADITKQSARAIISKTINLMIRSILKMPFKDTQCGAKVMHRSLVPELFSESFVTRWLFDVEIFMRMRLRYGRQEATAMNCEMPLKRWIHADGSKLSMKDSLKIGGQLWRILRTYSGKAKARTRVATPEALAPAPSAV